MEHGYCGRDCAACDIREDYGCAGCRETAGVPPHGPCPAAACCQGRELERCGDCGAVDCALLPDRAGPEAAAHLTENRLAALGGPGHAALLARGLDRLFWMVFVRLGGNFLLLQTGRALALPPRLSLAAETLWAVTAAVLTWRGLRWLQEGSPGYRPALKWWLASTASFLLYTYGARWLRLSGPDLLVTTLGLLLNAGYYWTLFGAMAEALRAVGHRRSRAWRALQLWTAGLTAAGAVVSLLLGRWELRAATDATAVPALPLIAASLLLLAAALAVAVIVLIQLRRTAETFRRLAGKA